MTLFLLVWGVRLLAALAIKLADFSWLVIAIGVLAFIAGGTGITSRRLT